MRSVYLIGPPGSGKSTIMKHLVAELGLSFGRVVSLCRETSIQWLGDDAWMWGYQRYRFPGTDALGMAASRYLREWIEAGGQLPSLTLGEGVRLANVRFLLTLDSVRPVSVVYLWAPEEVLQARCTARNGDLKATYKTVAATRAEKLAGELEALGIPVMRINTRWAGADLLAKKIVTELGL